MSACTCNQSFNIDFAPITIAAKSIWVGYSATIQVHFVDPADISLDDFTATVKDSGDNIVTMLTIGSGINIIGTQDLHIIINSPITDIADNYTMTVVWTPVSTGVPQPFSFGIINVIPAP